MPSMNITTANIKKPNYNGGHEIYIGTHMGSFKRIRVYDKDPFQQENLQTIGDLKKGSRVTALNWDANDQILIGRENGFVGIYDTNGKQFVSNVEMGSKQSIVGLARYNSKLVAGLSNGNMKCFDKNETVELQCGDQMTRLIQCPFDMKLVATGGKDRQNNLKIYDLESNKMIFTSKNLPNDYLQLEVPIWDCDIGFIDPNSLLTCSRYGYIRRYDTRVQRRPVINFSLEKDKISYTCLATHQNSMYVGSTTGLCYAFDNRKLITILHTYKGFTGSVSDIVIDETGDHLFTACLDRFVRVHCTKSTVLQYQTYIKTKGTNILVKTVRGHEGKDEEECELIENDNVEIEETDQKVGSDPEFDEIFDQMETVSEETATRNKRKLDSNTKKDKLKKKQK